MNLEALAEPFPLEDIEWRPSRSGIGGRDGIFCLVLAYITARAIQNRLDDVCGPGNWRNEEPRIIEVNGKSAFVGGISIRLDQWVTKWDVSEPTAERGSISAPAKGGFSGAMKRAGAQWGIGRYLYYLDETFAEVSEKNNGRGWNYATIKTDDGQKVFYWKAPGLPAWALPKESEHEVSKDELSKLKRAWQEKFASDVTNPGDIFEGFVRFVHSVVGDFPVSDVACWTKDALHRVSQRIETTTEANGVDSDVPFE